MIKRSILQPLGSTGLLLLAACGGGGSDGVGGGLTIVSCSLGCSSVGGSEVTCGIDQVFVNQLIAVEFSEPIDVDSLNPFSFQVVSETGSTPTGEYLIDPNNPNRVLFRPLVTFGSDGLPEFGFDSELDYTITIPAVGSGQQGFLVRSLDGSSNTTSLACTVTPALGIKDVVPGAPVVTTLIEDLDAGTTTDILDLAPGTEVAQNSQLRFRFNDVMNPASLVNVVTGTSNSIQVRVDLDGNITDPTDQLTVPGTFSLDIDQSLSSPSTTVIFTPLQPFPSAGDGSDGSPRQIVVLLSPQISDLGGNNLANPGTNSFQTTIQPSVVEELEVDFSGGTSSADYAGARLDAGRTGMLLDHDFVDAAQGVAGRLVVPLGGGSGRLGSLEVEPFTTVTLSTGPIPTVFGPELTTGPVVEQQGSPPEDVIVAYHVQARIIDDGLYPIDPFPTPGGDEWFDDGVLDNGPGTTTYTVADGVFEFSSLEVASGGTLQFVGDNPPRVFVRGNVVIDGLLRAEGVPAPSDVEGLGELVGVNGGASAGPGEDAGNSGLRLPDGSLTGDGVIDAFGGAGAPGGPGGGAGGRGADRSFAPGLLLDELQPFAADLAAAPVGAFPWNEPGFATIDPGTDLSIDGRNGLGRGGAAPSGGDDFGAGQGAPSTPSDFPGQSASPPAGDPQQDFGGLVVNNFCESAQFAAGGTGGSYAAPGGLPDYNIPGGLAALGGIVDPEFPEPSQFTSTASALDFELDPDRGGALVGGSGGGGGGAGVAYTKNSGLPFQCSNANPLFGPTLVMLDFYDARGAGGGGGGGALQLQAGNSLILDGTISVRGGRGGGLDGTAPPERGAIAPGGGGSGGSLLLQATRVDLAPFPGLIDLRGGDGGRTAPTGSRGGAGSPGVLQIENGANLVDFGPLTSAFTPAELPVPLADFAGTGVFEENGQTVVGARVAPELSTEATQADGPFLFSDVLTVREWTPNLTGPGAPYGLQTCWIEPEGDAFSVEFLGDELDDNGNIAVDENGDLILGWDLDLQVVGLPNVISFRTPLDPLVAAALGFSGSIELAGGNSLGVSPIVVRFQGARAIEPIDDPCQVFLTGPASPILDGSVTPWLTSPEEVAMYWSLLSDLNPEVDNEISPERQVSAGVAVQRQPNLIRAQVIVDPGAPLGNQVFSIVGLRLRALLD